MTTIAAAALHVPRGSPTVGKATAADVTWALTRAARYLAAGGSRDLVAAYVDEWLDYQAGLDLVAELELLTTTEEAG